ncbi:helix-turn-helix domain-containing protein [Paenibacillus sp. FSL L8-0340]|uniref:helix-turn-helix domain-containing protein n=1 Tax=Paenibacillus sp. FSL L8-0340 TaxID=2954685 RepID=UPI0031589469
MNTAMKQTSDKRLYERYLAVRFPVSRDTFDEIGELLSRTRQTISIYWQAYQAQGLTGLEMDHSPGQPKKTYGGTTPSIRFDVEQQQPADVGFEAVTLDSSIW